jgi:hypothetical protein
MTSSSAMLGSTCPWPSLALVACPADAHATASACFMVCLLNSANPCACPSTAEPGSVCEPGRRGAKEGGLGCGRWRRGSRGGACQGRRRGARGGCSAADARAGAAVRGGSLDWARCGVWQPPHQPGKPAKMPRCRPAPVLSALCCSKAQQMALINPAQRFILFVCLLHLRRSGLRLATPHPSWSSC